MSILNKLVILHFLPSMVFGTIDMKINSLFPSISNDDACSYVINEYPCFKNILNVLAKYSNDNKQEIESLKLKVSQLEKLIEEQNSNPKENLHEVPVKSLAANEQNNNHEIDKMSLKRNEKSSYQQSEVSSISNDYQVDESNFISTNFTKVRNSKNI